MKSLLNCKFHDPRARARAHVLGSGYINYIVKCIISLNKRWGNHIKAGIFNVIIQDIAVHETND